MSRTYRKKKGLFAAQDAQTPRVIATKDLLRLQYYHCSVLGAYIPNYVRDYLGCEDTPVESFGDYVLLKCTSEHIRHKKLYRNGCNAAGTLTIKRAYLREFEKQLRMRNKQQLYKYLQKEYYEVMCSAKPQDSSRYYY